MESGGSLVIVVLLVLVGLIAFARGASIVEATRWVRWAPVRVVDRGVRSRTWLRRLRSAGSTQCARQGAESSEPARFRLADRRPDRADRDHDRALRRRRDGRAPAGRAVPQCRLREPDRVQERVHGRGDRRRGRGRGHLGGGAVFILLAVGALIGTWNMAGTIPTVVHYGIGLLSPTWFYVASAVICALVGMVTGSSWTTAGTLGVAFVGMANVLGLSEEIAAGAVICGAYFGDKMTLLSETTILVPKLVGGGLTVGTHIRNMFWTAGPALGISLVLFLIIGLNAEPREHQHRRRGEGPGGRVQHLAVNLLPLLLLVCSRS